MLLHGYWRSGAAYRVRIALALKGLSYGQATHDLRLGEQRDPVFLALNPQGLVPALQIDDEVLTQSSAILEWLEECFPATPLLPSDLKARAIVRGMAATVACDIHPLNNLRVLGALRDTFAADTSAVNEWTARWIGDGFGALEPMIVRHGRGFAFGDRATLVDCNLVPQIYSAERFGVNLSPYPALVAAGERARALAAAAAAHPARQPEADTA